MKRSFWLALLCLGAWCPQHLAAAETVNLEAGMAFPSVEEAGAARAVALGGAYVGIAEGSASLPWNPAGLAGLGAPELALHHNSTVVGSFQETAVLGLPLGPGNALGASVNFEDSGAIEGRDASGNQVGDYSARAYGATLGWGIEAPADLALGAAVKLNRQDLAGTGATAVAVDLGALWAPCRDLTFGAAYTNLGPNVVGYQLGQGLSLGASTYWMKGSDLQWLFALSGEAQTGADNSIHLGLESLIHHSLALRAGYTFDVPDPVQADGLLGWSFGAGVQMAGLSLDYAWVPLGEAGNIQRVSLTYAFGGAPKKARRHEADHKARS